MQSLRGVSLPNQQVIDLLHDEFVVGWSNIQKESHVGLSHGYRCDQTAVGTTNGAGGRNVQLVVLDADGTVLHVLPGFWHPDDLVDELRFALDVHRLWHRDDLDRAQKERWFATLHKARVRGLSADTIARSAWQDFDERHELSRYSEKPRDSIALDDQGKPHVKPLCTLMHERMAARPFVALEDFDMESFVDYGRPYYDNNSWLDKGREFRAAVRANAAREKAEARRAAELAKATGRRR